MNEKKKNNYFLRGVLVVFGLYTVLYFSEFNHYYQNSLHQEVILTEANMKEFEADIKEGKPIDIKKYQQYQEKDYGNLFSNTGYFIGNKLEYVMLHGIDEGIGVLKKLFSNK